MQRTTRKLSGPAKDRFLKRFFREERGLDPAVAEALANKSAATFTSLRVRRTYWSQLRAAESPALTSRPTGERVIKPAPATRLLPPDLVKTAEKATKLQDAPPENQKLAREPSHDAPLPGASPTEAGGTFDPHAFGLVPVFQREGRDGLLAKLAAVTTAGNLRKMARTQQISLPEPMRAGDDVALDDLRSAIADAVARRIADRKAAAG